MTTKNNAARVAVKAAACANQPADKPRDVFDCIAMGIPREDWEASLDNGEAQAWSAWLKQGEPVQAQGEEPKPLNLQETYRLQAECGYTSDLTLRAHQVQQITARLRSITAITGVLMVAADTEAIAIGEWIRSGLTEAIHALAEDAHYDLDRANEKAWKGGAA